MQAAQGKVSAGKVEEAVAAAAEAHESTMRRLRADLQRKASLLAAAKTDAEKHMAAAIQAKEETARLQAQGQEAGQALQAEAASCHATTEKVADLLRPLCGLIARSVAANHAGASPPPLPHHDHRSHTQSWPHACIACRSQSRSSDRGIDAQQRSAWGTGCTGRR